MNHEETIELMKSAIAKMNTDQSITDDEWKAMQIAWLSSAVEKLGNEDDPLDADEYEAVAMAISHEIGRLHHPDYRLWEPSK
jgi:hypothetical protein